MLQILNNIKSAIQNHIGPVDDGELCERALYAIPYKIIGETW
jgi:hypothetical protein